ncbi:ion transporter [Nocardioides panacisoli]|uniref:ion transporter n=1 Tax=Nocardioides panacisoli TaxID=627624 RepID=UPI001C633A67|nr:ion transporter [Nocardioides panacisoli]QYJ05521.1 ion transporter [Nocardioides panacisoli]
MSASAEVATPTSPHGSGPPRKPGRPAAPPVTIVDWLMLLLAIASVVLLSWVTFFEVDPTTERRVIVADYVVCGVFAVEFAWRWRRSGMGWRFLRTYWYEIIGMIPLSHPAFRSFRLLRIVIIVARLGRAIDRAFGDRAAAYVVGRFSTTIVNIIRKPVTVAVLDEVIAVIQTGTYADHVASALERNRDDLDDLVVDLIRQNQRTGRLKYVPFHDDVVRLVSDTVVAIVGDGLRDPRTHELIADAIQDSAAQLRIAVRAGDHEERRGA